jgi:predicted AAA+ superfamily ATPase
VDLILEKGGETFGVEVKASKKADRGALHGLFYWKKYQPSSNLILFHGGNTEDITNEGISILPWNKIAEF